MTARPPTILIAGAGVGGLTLGLGLKRLGIMDFLLVEQAQVLREVGAGIQITPNAVRVLMRLGLEGALRPLAVTPQALQARSWSSGRIIRDFPLGAVTEAKYGVSYYQLHRAHLHTALAEALGPEHIRLGGRCTGFTQDEDGVTLSLESGETLSGSILIGADGIHSVVRDGLFGAQEPQFSGTVAWRGLTPTERISGFSLEKNTNSWWGPRRHFVQYYVDGGKLINWVGVVPAGNWRRESWSQTGDHEEALREFEGWDPVVRAIIREAEQPFKWGLYDRDPMPHWTERRVTLLGDAAHPMLPFMSQGASQSIEDGYVLARCLVACAGDKRLGLLAYEAIRKERTARIQLGSRENGRTFHLTSPWAKLMRDIKFRIASLTERSATRKKLDWVYGYDCDVEVDRHFAAAA